jgi:transketolase
MKILAEQKLCRKGLHWYPLTDKQCKECKKKNKREWNKNNIDKIRKCNKRWQQLNRERMREAQKRWNLNHPDRRRKMNNRWIKENPGKATAFVAKRRAVKKKALVAWANTNAIKEIYDKAKCLSKATGVLHEVDHIYPLQSKYMCGLHVENNLQILTKSENSSKNNRIWPGQLDCQKN